MKDLWPYYSNKKRAFFKDKGKKAIFEIGEINGEQIVYWSGDRIKKTLMWNVLFTINLSIVRFKKKDFNKD